MFIVADERLLHEFLVEAGEIVEQLGGQLVELEQRPQDQELLNTVFRGFHTIKGGASFLSLDALVQVCHHAEDVFNLLRRGERAVDAGLMDAVLQALDTVNAIFQCLRAGQELPTPEPALLAALGALARPGGAPPPPCGSPRRAHNIHPPVGRSIRRRSVTDPVDREFEQLLAALDRPPRRRAQAMRSPTTSSMRCSTPCTARAPHPADRSVPRRERPIRWRRSRHLAQSPWSRPNRRRRRPSLQPARRSRPRPRCASIPAGSTTS